MWFMCLPICIHADHWVVLQQSVYVANWLFRLPSPLNLGSPDIVFWPYCSELLCFTQAVSTFAGCYEREVAIKEEKLL